MEKLIQVRVKITENDIVTLEAKPNDTIRELKKIIGKEKVFPPELQELYFGNNNLEDTKTLKDYNLHEESTLDLFARNKNAIPIFVRLRIDKYTVDVNLDWTVNELKKEIYRRVGLEANKQKLIFNSQTLSDKKTLKDCNIVKECTILLVPAFPGIMQIFVKLWTGKIYTLYVSKGYTIAKFKQIIYEKMNLKPVYCKLIFMTMQLEDNKTLDDYNIVQESTVLLHPLKGDAYQINVKLPGSKTIPLEILSLGTIKGIKNLIHGKVGFKSEKQMIIYSDKLLDDNKTLEYYNIVNNTTIQMVLNSPDEIFLYITLTPETEIVTGVNSNATIWELKSDICTRESLDPEKQELVFGDRILKDIKKLADYNIKQGHTLNLIPKVLDNFPIKIEISDGKVYDIEVNSCYIVIQLKYTIHSKTNITPSNQSLVFDGKLLENEKTLISYGIKEGSCIRLT